MYLQYARTYLDMLENWVIKLLDKSYPYALVALVL